MRKGLLKYALTAIALAGGGWVAYDYFKGGFHTRPPMPEGAFSLSYHNGLRAIVVGRPDLRRERKYLGVPVEVPSWYRDVWSFCTAPTAKERAAAPNMGPGARLEAVCRIDVDGQQLIRGAIYSVPKQFPAPPRTEIGAN
jgi:hypothetical protein